MVSRILYYGILYLLSLLPMKVLYGLSYIIYLLLSKILRYRHKVITENIHNSFPYYTPKEIAIVQDDFYKHIADVIVESIKSFSSSKEFIHSRTQGVNMECINDYGKIGKSIMAVGAHYNNWEWAAAVALDIQYHKTVVVYQKLKNEYINRKIVDSRQKGGYHLVPAAEIKEYMHTHAHENTCYVFLADQSPSDPDKAYWLPFLNQPTAMHFGIEKYAKEYDLPIIHGEVTKISRGFYTNTLEILIPEVSNMQHGVISEIVAARIETTIQKKPCYWLWSHRRWKHKPKIVA